MTLCAIANVAPKRAIAVGAVALVAAAFAPGTAFADAGADIASSAAAAAAAAAVIGLAAATIAAAKNKARRQEHEAIPVKVDDGRRRPDRR